MRRAAPLKLKCRRVDATAASLLPFRRPPRWSVCEVCGRADGRTGPLPLENHSCLAGEIPSAPPPPAAWSVRPVWTRCSIHDVCVCVCVCSASVFVLGVFWSCFCLCRKGARGLRLHHVFSLVVGVCSPPAAQPTSSYPFPEPAVQTGVDMVLPWKEGCSQRPWGRPREGRAVLDERMATIRLNPIHAHHRHSNSGSSSGSRASHAAALQVRPSFDFLLSSLTATDPWIG